jgi:hypothetical protein
MGSWMDYTNREEHTLVALEVVVMAWSPRPYPKEEGRYF